MSTLQAKNRFLNRLPRPERNEQLATPGHSITGEVDHTIGAQVRVPLCAVIRGTMQSPAIRAFTQGDVMGTFSVGCIIANVVDRARQARLSRMLVDTGSEYTWVPAQTLERIGVAREKKDVEFIMANGQRISRSVGFAIVRVEESFTVDEVVFAEKGDLLLLGARSLEGLKLAVDPRRKKLVAAGPVPAAHAQGLAGRV